MNTGIQNIGLIISLQFSTFLLYLCANACYLRIRSIEASLGFISYTLNATVAISRPWIRIKGMLLILYVIIRMMTLHTVEFNFQAWVNLWNLDKSLFPSLMTKFQLQITLIFPVKSFSDFFETVFSIVNLFLLMNVLALRCSCVKLSLLNLFFVVIFQPTQIPLDIIHIKFLKEVIEAVGSRLLSIVNSFLSSDSIPDYLKKTSVQPFL